MKLSKTEEDLMSHLWKLEKAFMKDLLDAYPRSQTCNNHYRNTVKTYDRQRFCRL